jgi:signal transduction histidine kinase
VASLRPVAAAQGLQLEAPTTDAIVWADADKVTQVLMNLLGNALKFTPADGQVTVTVAHDGGAWVQIAVADTGPGIAADDAAHIFDPFYQTADMDLAKRHGTGLGLAIAKTLVEMHGGRLWVESTVGHGSTFRFTLPVGPPVKPAAAPPAEERV